jgi:5-methyltetrahydropteroyltriglutamate--homocysteine methyltransferase
VRKSNERILTTHAGSLVRTPEIIEAMMRDYVGRPLADAELNAVLSTGVAQVVAKQREIGIDVVSDGEFGKKNWIGYLGDRLKNVTQSHLASPGEQSRASVYPDQDRFGAFYQEHVQHEYTQWLPDTPTKGEYIEAGPAFIGANCTGPIEYIPGSRPG